MIIYIFLMNRIKNMDQIYTCTPIHVEKLVCNGKEEHYHCGDYCKGALIH